MSESPLRAYQHKIEHGDFTPDAAQHRALEALERLYHDLTAKKKQKTIKGVYLHGGVGRGKTAVMDLFFACVPDFVGKRRVHFHAFMIGVHEALHKARSAKNGDSEVALLKYAKSIAAQTRLLCFDEFHVTDIADAMILSRLFTALLDAGVAIVATSNWTPDRLYEGGLQRDRFVPFIKLVKERLEIIEVDGGVDYRTHARGGARYFSPLGSAAKEWADRVFSFLTDTCLPSTDTLTVKGRQISVLTAAGVARLSFAQLCEQPMGAEDYLAIAKRYHTVLLEGIPKMGYDRRNEAKRFMILIDALYDRGTALYASADAPPERLYTGHDHAFEFQRTVSRLTEMQSESYEARRSIA